MDNSKVFGSVLLIVGTAIGGGILGMPLVSAQLGFTVAATLLISVWVLATVAALYVLEVNLALDSKHGNFNDMARITLGKPGQIAAWTCCIFLLYSLTAAYIDAGASLLAPALHSMLSDNISRITAAIVFTVFLGAFVMTSTRAVDKFNQALFSIKGLLFFIIMSVALPQVQAVHLQHPAESMNLLLLAGPVFLTAFGYHHIVPSITEYLNRDAIKSKRVIIFGSLIPLAVYLLWEFVTLGNLPATGAVSFASVSGDVHAFVTALGAQFSIKNATAMINTFAHIALITSFLGVTLGLFDFLRNALGLNKHNRARFLAAIATFLPPLIFALVYPSGFELTLSYAALFLAMLGIVLPTLMARKLRAQNHPSVFTVSGGALVLNITLVGGIAIMLAVVVHALNWV